jgi:prepilin-type N-terminal cleavage/methylation domain-containing protein
MKNLFTKKQRSGFSLIEMLVYVSVLAILMIALSELFFWIVRNQNKIRAIHEATNDASLVIESIAKEIKSGQNVYLPTSVFDSDAGQLSLKTTAGLPQGETGAYLDFYLCQSRLCLKKEGQLPVALTSDLVEIKKLRFSRAVTGGKESIHLIVQADFKNPGNIAEKRASVILDAVASLRDY